MASNVLENEFLDSGSENDELGGEESVEEISWFKIGILCHFVFSDLLKQNPPEKSENIYGKCDVCNRAISGRRSALRNYKRHYEVSNFFINNF